jgi:hypothetical protein
MSHSQNFLDNLENLLLVTSAALEHVQDDRDTFAKSATGAQMRQAEKCICQVRVLVVQLEREFTILEYLTAEGDPCTPTFPLKSRAS